MSKKRYLCPKHKESTPSAVAYHDNYFCFGCGAKGPVADLGIPAGERIEVSYVEDLPASIDRIKGLPQRSVRGFNLHHNDRGYYLLWPDNDYYKYRSLTVDTPGGKYRGPSGHSKPWFNAQIQGHTSVVVVEGEFNALSLASIEEPVDVVSPGGAGDFFSKNGEKQLLSLSRYVTIYLVADNDKAGAIATIEAASKLYAAGNKDVRISLLEKDFNDIHTSQGKDALQTEFRKMVLRGGLRPFEKGVPAS